MLEITVLDWEDTDLDEVASLTFEALQGSPFSRPDRTLRDVEVYLDRSHERFPASAVFLARIDGRLVGWLAVTLDVKPGTSETWRWTPYVSSEAMGREEEVARALIGRCIEHVKERGQTRLEACFDRVTDAAMPEYERYKGWFEAEGVARVDESAYMRRGLTPGEFTEGDAALPPGYAHIPMVDADEEALYGCYVRAFEESGVRSYHSMTEGERRAEFEHYFGDEAVNEGASTVVVMVDEVVGFSLVHSRPGEAHLAELGVAPGHRGRGLGRGMIAYSLMNATRDHDSVTLAVDVDNASALNLYRELGFDVDYSIITHAWKPG